MKGIVKIALTVANEIHHGLERLNATLEGFLFAFFFFFVRLGMWCTAEYKQYTVCKT